MTYQNDPVQDWSALAEGTQVAITEPGGARFLATVDTKTADSAVVWVVDNDGQRRAFGHREGVEFAILPESAVLG